MRTEKEIRQVIKDELCDNKNCTWHKPCASCFKGQVIIHALRWVLGERKEILGVRQPHGDEN